MNKRPEQTARTRNLIVDAFWELYEENPIERIAVKEIVAKAGCHRSTFYEYFNDVYEVLNYLEESLLAKLKSDLQNRPENPDSDAIIRRQIESFEEEGKYFSVLASENGDPSFAKKVHDIFSESMGFCFATDLTADQVDYLTCFTSGGFSSIVTKWVREGKKLPVEDLILITHVFKELEAKLLKGEVRLNKPQESKALSKEES